MRRRSRASSKSAKARSRKAQGLKRRNALPRRHHSSTADLLQQLDSRTRERDEARKQQAATAEILSLISNSPTDTLPVFKTILAKAVELCEASFGALWLVDGKGYRTAAMHGDLPRPYVQQWRSGTLHFPKADIPMVRAIRSRKTVHTQDVRKERAYLQGEPLAVSAADVGGIRTMVTVPMLKGGEAVGAIAIYRREVLPSPARHVELVESFAAQAVIAIENARLLNELRESLQQQTATSEVLKIISGSPGELEPVFNAMLENATRLCEARFGTMWLREGDAFRAASLYGPMPPVYTDLLRGGALFHASPDTPTGRVAQTRQPVQVLDLRETRSRDPIFLAAVEVAGVRTMFAVPMLKEGELVGTISIYRQEILPFTNKQIELVQNFAAQAVIAIENARLLNELHQRTDDLTESLEQQTATSKVLDVISRSAFDLQTVFETVAESAVRLCGADRAFIYRLDGQLLRMAAAFNATQKLKDFISQNPIRPGRGSTSGRAVLERRTVQIPDVLADPEFTYGTKNIDNLRTILAVPILKGDDVLGVLTIFHLEEVKLFTDKQIALLETFADQAAIAIDNVRLLDELRQSLQQQTATADVLKVISRSTFDLQAVLDTLMESAARLCEADKGYIGRPRGDGFFRSEASYGFSPALKELVDRTPWKAGRESAIGRVLLEHAPVQIADAAADPEYRMVELQKVGRYHTILGVPLMREGVLTGVLSLARSSVRPFTDKQVELLTTFADQAVIAIENVRLFEAEQQRTRELTESLEQQTATSEVLKIVSSSPGELEPVFQAMLQNATQLCDAKFGVLFEFADGAFRALSNLNTPPALVNFNRELRVWGPHTALGRLAHTKQAVHVEDALADRAYREDTARQAAVPLGGVRTLLAVPMLKEEVLVGAITIFRQEARPFTDKQIALVTNFAAQAVIAIENARLLNELRQRTTDLTESLEQQTATSKVLEVISRSAFDLQAVFDTVAESSVRLCGADRAFIWRFDGELLQLAVAFNAPQKLKDFISQNPIRPARDSATGRTALERRTVHIPDVLVDPEYTYGAKDVEKLRTLLGVPILKGDELLGVLGIYTLEEVRPFTDKQIALVETFADQAAIAIDNVRLLDELRHRTDELGRSVGELQALGEVSQAVNSTLDLETVLTTIVAKAVQLSRTEAGVIYVFNEQDQTLRVRATYGLSDELVAAIRGQPAGASDALRQAIQDRQPLQIADIRDEPPSPVREIAMQAGFRARLVVPLVGTDRVVGALVVRRKQPGNFSKDTIELLQTFAAHSVLAIQNARLFREIGEKGRELEEASQHKSQFLANMSHELRTPLNAILGYTELMADGAYGEPSQKMLGILKRLEANGRHLLGLINDVLDLSKIEAGQLVLELSEYCIQDIAQTVRSTLEPLAADKKLRFKVEMTPQLPPGRGDGRRLTQVLINLVGNAIKFTDAGEVAIKAEANNGLLHVSVRDTGPGISATDQAKLFQEFQQADNAITRKKGGTGLGLAISKRIIEMHGGRIWVESQPGQGSTFAFTLPVIVERQVEPAA